MSIIFFDRHRHSVIMIKAPAPSPSIARSQTLSASNLRRMLCASLSALPARHCLGCIHRGKKLSSSPWTARGPHLAKAHQPRPGDSRPRSVPPPRSAVSCPAFPIPPAVSTLIFAS